jgi:hypothetical protein
MLHFQPFLGDGLIDLLAKGIPIILFVLWLIGQAVTEKQKQAKKVAAPRPPRPVPAPEQGPLQPKAQRAATEIEDEIDAFLRRAAEKKGQAPPQPRREETVILLPQKEEARKAQPSMPAAPRKETAPARGRPLSKPLSSKPAGGQAASRPSVAGAKATTSAQPPRSPAASYQESIRGPLSAPLSQRQSHLGEVVALADDKIEAHLQQVFQHQVGRLQQSAAIPVREVGGSPIARSVAEMLKSPQGIQQMIVLGEIMRRPEV